MSKHSRQRSLMLHNNASLQQAIARGVAAELERRGLTGQPHPPVQPSSVSQLPPYSTPPNLPTMPNNPVPGYNPRWLGGTPGRTQQILANLAKANSALGAPASNFMPADQSIMELMYQALAPQSPDSGTPLYAPGVPLLPISGITPPTGPRQWSFPVGGNISMAPRGERQWSFDDLRAMAQLYDGFAICEQVWLDYVAKLELVIEPRPGLLKEDMDASVFDKDIALYQSFFEYPDKQRSYRDWLQLAVKEQLEIDALAIYPHLTRGGDLYALEILDSSTIKPLMDDRGRRPQPPFPAYAQYLYGGVPAAWLTTDELVYLIETERTDDLYGTSRVEKVLMRANQALRKQSKDLLKFTEGTVPAGFIQVPADSGWTQDALEEFEINLNALMAGNDMQRARLKVLPRGFAFINTDDPAIQTIFDTFLMNITASAFGLTMAELGFTENVNKSSGESQENVVYRRTMAPLISRYEDLLTMVLRKYFNESRFVVKFKGFEEVEDFQAQAATFVSLVTAGIQSPTQAAQALHLPVYEDVNVPPFLNTKTGLIVLSDLADSEVRAAMTAAQLAAAAPPKSSPSTPVQEGGDGNDGGEDEDAEDAQNATIAHAAMQKPSATGSVDQTTQATKKAATQRATSADYRRWRERAIDDVKAGRDQRGFTTSLIPPYIHSYISQELTRCTTPDAVRAVFASVKQQAEGAVA